MASPDRSPLYPARLDHVQVTSPDPARLAGYYRDVLGGTADQLPGAQWLVAGAERKLVFAQGAANQLGYAAFRLQDGDQLSALRNRLSAHQLTPRPSPSRLFGDEAFAVGDPDGNTVVFGLSGVRAADPEPDRLPGRLQHVVLASDHLTAMMAFYGEILGFRLSDRVLDDKGDVSAAFYRSDEEHHSFACFRAPARCLDHICFETTCWNDIRDWADHLATLRLEVGWGPGRHGPGNNLFFMLGDPDGNAFEFSAEIERLDYDIATRDWPHEPRTLNYWGAAWMRS